MIRYGYGIFMGNLSNGGWDDSWDGYFGIAMVNYNSK